MDKSVVVFSLLNWESKLLHRGHMLAKYFSQKGYSVYYVQKENISSPFQLEFRPKYYISDNINIVSLPAFPYLHGKIKAVYTLNDYIFTKQLKTLFSQLKQPLILLESPYWIKAVNQIKDRERILCYDISDDLLQFTTNEKWKRILSYYEKEAIERSDYIFITSEELRTKVKDRKNRVFLIENGIDLKEFESSKKILEHIKKPICGFIGGLFQWIDFDLLEKAAEKYPNFNLVLIGPTDQADKLEKLCQRPNVHYLGEKDKSVIGDYFASLDIGLIPFVSEDKYPRLKTVNSNKVFQYCYYGYPVITTKFQQVLSLNNVIKVTESHEEFLDSMGMALETNSLEEQEKRRRFALNNSWEKRVEDIIEIVRNRY